MRDDDEEMKVFYSQMADLREKWLGRAVMTMTRRDTLFKVVDVHYSMGSKERWLLLIEPNRKGKRVIRECEASLIEGNPRA